MTAISWTRVRIVGAVLLALGVIALIATFNISSARFGWSISGPRFARSATSSSGSRSASSPATPSASGSTSSSRPGRGASDVLQFAANLLDGFADVLTPTNLLLAAPGVTLGTLVGVLPGIGPALTVALLLPITFNFSDPVGAFILFAGIYAGGMYGGSTTSILLNTPGESASVATAIEGYEMAKRGRAKAALATAAIG